MKIVDDQPAAPSGYCAPYDAELIARSHAVLDRSRALLLATGIEPWPTFHGAAVEREARCAVATMAAAVLRDDNDLAPDQAQWRPSPADRNGERRLAPDQPSASQSRRP